MPKTYTPKEIRELRNEAYQDGRAKGENWIRRLWIVSEGGMRNEMKAGGMSWLDVVERCEAMIDSLTTQINESEADNE